MASQASTGAGKPRRKRYPIEHYDRCSLMLISMIPYSEIEKQMSMAWGKPRTYVRSLIKQIHEDWAEGAAQTQHTRRHQIRQGMEALFMKATQKGDLQTAARVITELGRLDGCYQPEQVAVTHQGQVGVGIALGTLGFKSSDEVADRIEHLKQMLAQRGPQALAPGQDLLVAQAQLTGIAPDNHSGTTNGVAPDLAANAIDVPTGEDDGGVS